jgi:hypothetical protein
MMNLITPESHPEHSVVGCYFAGYSYLTGKTEIYHCDSYDPALGYWLTCVTATDRKNVSERAIGRTFYEAQERQDDFYCPQWNVRVEKAHADSRPGLLQLTGGI